MSDHDSIQDLSQLVAPDATPPSIEGSCPVKQRRCVQHPAAGGLRPIRVLLGQDRAHQSPGRQRLGNDAHHVRVVPRARRLI